jgi:hypothetical protein
MSIKPSKYEPAIVVDSAAVLIAAGWVLVEASCVDISSEGTPAVVVCVEVAAGVVIIPAGVDGYSTLMLVGVAAVAANVVSVGTEVLIVLVTGGVAVESGDAVSAGVVISEEVIIIVMAITDLQTVVTYADIVAMPAGVVVPSA